MRPWASWAAKTAVFSLAAGLAATGGGLPGVALAASGSAALAARSGSASLAARSGSAALARSGSAALAAGGGAAGSGQVADRAMLASDVCSDAGALLGIAGAACQSVPLVGSSAAAPAQAGQSTAAAGRAAAGQRSSQGTSGQRTAPGSSQGTAPGSSRGTGLGASQGSAPATAQGSSQGLGATVGQVVQRAVAPLTAVLGAGGSVPKSVPALTPVTAGNGAPSSRVAGASGASAPGTDRTSGHAPAIAGDTNVPAATQLAGLGALPGLADLPSAGPASTPARKGAQGGGIPMPGTALSAASSGMSSDSFAALAVGALLAGASALKIAGRRARDRKAGLEQLNE
jgi:type IV secretion system protein TrbL